MYKKGDFHIHSTASDGEFNPEEIIKISKERKVDIISITDHNTTKSIEEAIYYGEKYKIKVIPGVEISTRYKGSKVHILGYFKNEMYKKDSFQIYLKLIKNHNIKKLKNSLKGIININIDSNRLSTVSGIKLLKLFDAVVVLAHPITVNKEYVNDVMKLDFDGIEAKHYRNKVEDTEYFINKAIENNMFYTAGSDFHNTNSKDLKHGMIGDVFLNSEEIEIFLNNLFY